MRRWRRTAWRLGVVWTGLIAAVGALAQEPEPAQPASAQPQSQPQSQPAAGLPAPAALPVQAGEAQPFARWVTGKAIAAELRRVVVSLTLDGQAARLSGAGELPTGITVAVDPRTGWATLTPTNGDAFPADALDQALGTLQFDPPRPYVAGAATLRITAKDGAEQVAPVSFVPPQGPFVLALGPTVAQEALVAGDGCVTRELAAVPGLAARFTGPVTVSSQFDAIQVVDPNALGTVKICLAKDTGEVDPSRPSPYRVPRADLFVRVEGKDANGNSVSADVYAVPAVDAALTASHLVPKLRAGLPGNLGSRIGLFGWNQQRLDTASIAWRKRPNGCNSNEHLNDYGNVHGLTCDQLQVRLDVDGVTNEPWVPLTQADRDWVTTTRLSSALAERGESIPFDAAAGHIERRSLRAQFWVAQVGAPTVDGTVDRLVGEQRLGPPVNLDVGWENRNRWTFAAHSVPAAVGLTILRCDDILAKGNDQDPLGTQGTLARTCAEEPGRSVATTTVALAPAGARLRFAPSFASDTFGFYVDARFLEFGASFNTWQGPAGGLLSAGSIGGGADARFSVGDQNYFFFVRPAVTGVLVDQSVHARPLFELGLAIPLLSTGSGGVGGGKDGADGKDGKDGKNGKDGKDGKDADGGGT